MQTRDSSQFSAALAGVAFLVFLVATLGCSSGGSGGDDAPPTDAAAQAALAAHVISRTAFSRDAWTSGRMDALGVDAYLEEQLAPASIPDPDVDVALASYGSLDLDFFELFAQYQADPFVPLQELIDAKLLRATLSRRQLEEVLVDFWFNHFNIFAADGFSNYVIGPYERDAIRPHVLGRFEDMLKAVARNPVMLYYLDNFLSSRDGFVFENEVRGINENYARELMELHTLGVDGGYDQDDVIDVARALTGWTIGPIEVADSDGFFFWDAAHDDGAKLITGDLFIPADGNIQDGFDLFAFLAAHPSTARFLCGKLVVRFVSEAPQPGLVDRCAVSYAGSDGDLREVMRTLLFSDEFRDPAIMGAKVKRPMVFLAGLLRVTGADPTVELPRPPEAPLPVLDVLNFFSGLLGESIYQARPPTGHPDASRAWASGGTLLSRFNLITALVSIDTVLGIDWGVSGGSDSEIVDALVVRLFERDVAASTRSAAIDHVSGLGPVADALRVREAATVLLAAPDFMRH